MVLIVQMYNNSSNSNFVYNNNNFYESSNASLNISGRRFSKISSSKTIWSYNPEDILSKKLNTKWRPNTRSLRNLPPHPSPASGIMANPFVDESTNSTIFKAKMNRNLNEILSPRSYNARLNSASSTSGSSKSKVHPTIVTTTTPTVDNMNKFVENNTSASRRLKKEEEIKQQQQQQQQQQQTLLKQQTYRLSLNPITNEKQERINKREILNRNIKKMIAQLNTDNVLLNEVQSGNNNKSDHITYGKHIDNLTSELFAALHKGINKDLLKRKSARQQDDKSVSSLSNASSISNIIDFNDDLDYQDLNDSQFDDDNFVVKICNEIKTYKSTNGDDAINDNVSTTQEPQSLTVQTVNTILNSSNIEVNKIAKKSVTIVEPNKYIKQKETSASSVASLNIPKSFKEINIKKREENDEDGFPPYYFDAKFHVNDFEYRYKTVINEQFREILDQYDGNLPVEVVLKQALATNDYYQALTASTPNPNQPQPKPNEKSAVTANKDVNSNVEVSKNGRKQSAKAQRRPKTAKSDDTSDTNYVNEEYEMYNVFKRMMVKKKYEVATIKLEKATALNSEKRKNKRNGSAVTLVSNQSAPNLTTSQNNQIKMKQRPSSSSSLSQSVNNISILNNPKKSNFASKPFPEDDDEEFENIDEDYLIDEPVLRCMKCKKLVNLSDEKKAYDKNNKSDDLYDDYKMSKDSFGKKACSFELDSTNEYNEKGLVNNDVNSNQKNLNKKYFRCYTCTNFLVKNEFASKSEVFTTKEHTITNNSKTEPVNKTPIEQKQFLFSTFNAARRCMSAKNIQLTNQELTDEIDKAENSNLTCSHPKLMSQKDLVQYQRKVAIIPGKTFQSQRRQSITLNRPPLSKIKADYDKENTVSYLYPLNKSNTITNINLIGQQSRQNIEATSSTNELDIYQLQQEIQNQIQNNSTINGNITRKSKSQKINLKYFKIDPFIPVLNTKLKLYTTNDQMRQSASDTTRTNKTSGSMAALHVYKKTSKLINKRPKTAK